MTARLTVVKHPISGLAIVGCDAYGHSVNVPIDRLSALNLAAALETSALTPRGRLVDTREPFDQSECDRPVERT